MVMRFKCPLVYEILYFGIFYRGRGSGPPDPPPLDPHMYWIYNQYPIMYLFLLG